jgi:hypothetical protein
MSNLGFDIVIENTLFGNASFENDKNSKLFFLVQNTLLTSGRSRGGRRGRSRSPPKKKKKKKKKKEKKEKKKKKKKKKGEREREREREKEREEREEGYFYPLHCPFSLSNYF